MELDGSKHMCGICVNWNGKREFSEGVAHVKSSAKGQCALLKRLKPSHGGCDQWEQWNGSERMPYFPS